MGEASTPSASEMRTKAPTFLKKMIQEKTKLENLAEELRVLYVAMTRAKEKLILTGSLKMGEDGLEPYVNHMTDRESSLSLYQLEGANRYLDWILPALLQEEDLVDHALAQSASWTTCVRSSPISRRPNAWRWPRAVSTIAAAARAAAGSRAGT